MRRTAALQQPVEMQQTAARRPVMPGAEGEPGLDLDADVAGPQLVAVMRAMDEEPPGANRLQPRQRVGDPVLLFGEAELDQRRRLLPRRRRDQFAQAFLVGLEAEIDLDRPSLAPARPRRLGLERGGGGLRRLEALHHKVGDSARARLVERHAQDMGGVVGRQAFQHKRIHSRKSAVRLRCALAVVAWGERH